MVANGDGDLGAELVALVGLALGDADHLRGMERIELVLVVVLLAEQALDQTQKPGEALLRFAIAFDLARHIAGDPAEVNLELFHLAPHAPHLPGMGVTAGLNRRLFGQTGVALAQLDALALGLADQGVLNACR